jgi:predicted ribosome quality control (RQC) complex YloA/Tae2 family protein
LTCHFFFFFFFSSQQGNIILVDKNYAIETLIRSYKTGEGTDDEVSVAVGTRYPVDKARQLVPTTVDRLREVTSCLLPPLHDPQRQGWDLRGVAFVGAL